MGILVKVTLVFGLLTLVENREWMESNDLIRDEKGQSMDENENFGDFVSKIRTVDSRSHHLVSALFHFRNFKSLDNSNKFGIPP